MTTQREKLEPGDSIAMVVEKQAIVDVAIRYCRALDTKEWSLLDQVFVADAEATLSGSTIDSGLPAIVARVSDTLGHLRASHHLVGNHEVVLTGHTASHFCYLQAQHVAHMSAPGARCMIGGQYDDSMVKTSEGWRIVKRTLTVIWVEGDPAVIDPPT